MLNTKSRDVLETIASVAHLEANLLGTAKSPMNIMTLKNTIENLENAILTLKHIVALKEVE